MRKCVGMRSSWIWAFQRGRGAIFGHRNGPNVAFDILWTMGRREEPKWMNYLGTGMAT